MLMINDVVFHLFIKYSTQFIGGYLLNVLTTLYLYNNAKIE